MKKRMLTLLLALVLIIGLLPVTAHAGELDNGLQYEVYTDHVEITGYSAFGGQVVIPSEIEGLPVTVIGSGAFWGSYLKSITIPASVQVVEACAFAYCYNLSEIHFLGNAPTPEYDLNDESGESKPFYGVTATTYYPSGDPTWTTDVMLGYGGSITWIALRGWGELDNGLQYKALADHVEITGYSAFGGQVVIPSEIEGLPVTVIGSGAFCDSYLNSITIPASVLVVEARAFAYCHNLSEIHFLGNAPTPEYVLSDEGGETKPFYTVTATTYYPYGDPTWTTDVMRGYGGDITWIALRGLGELDNGLQYKAFGDHVEIIGYTGDAAELVIPSEIEGIPVTDIAKLAFGNCSGLTSIHIPESVTSISDLAFYECNNLAAIYFTGNAPKFGARTFECEVASGVVATVYYPADNPTWTDEVKQNYGGTIRWVAFGSSSSLEDLVYEVFEDHVEIIGYTRFTTEIVIPAEIEGLPVTSIGDNAFYNCVDLTSISIPNSITAIGKSAFGRCSNLTHVEIPNNVTSIGIGAFAYCSSLTHIEIPDSITSIGGYAFQNCSSLTSIVIPAGVTMIGNTTFGFCYNLTSIEIPDSVTTIGSGAFWDCSSLDHIEIPNSVNSIGYGAFDGCTSLSDINFHGNAPAFGGKVFSGVTAIAHYPGANPTWTEEVMQSYGGTITWSPYYPDNFFSDVPVGAFYEAPVLWALEKGITSGTSESEFSPNDSCLRAHVVTFLWRAAGKPAATSKVNPFVDVKPTDYYYDAVLWAVEKGITTGADATHFEPNGVCNRAQVVTFLYRAFEQPPVSDASNPFTDVPNHEWYAAPVLWAVKEGITNGLSETKFGPNDTCNRSQVVTFLYRAYN